MFGDSRPELHAQIALDRLSELAPEIGANLRDIREAVNVWMSGDQSDLVQLEAFDADFCAGQLYDRVELARGYFGQLGIGPDADALLTEIGELRDQVRSYGRDVANMASGHARKDSDASSEASGDRQDTKLLLHLKMIEVEESYQRLKGTFDRIGEAYEKTADVVLPPAAAADRSPGARRVTGAGLAGQLQATTADSPIASAVEFHETLVDAFSTAADTAVWLAQFNCGWADPNAEAVGRLKRLVPMVDRLTRADSYLETFAKGRIATKAVSEAAKIQGPNGEWYASYHDAAFGLIVALLNYATLPHCNEAGQLETYLVTSDPINASQNNRIRGRQWFDKVMGEYLAGMATEAAGVPDMSAGHGLRGMANVEAAADRLADRLRQLADRLETEWPSVASTPNQPAPHARNRFAILYAVEAGKALIEAERAGVFDDEGKAVIERACAPYIDKGLRNWEHRVFLHLVQHWLQHRAPGYGGRSMTYPDIALEPPDKQLLGIKYARNMRAIADAVRPASDTEMGSETKGDPLRPAHSPDFRSVRWFGAEYTFTPNQAACIKVLWEAWKNGTPTVGGATLLEVADACTQRINVVFRGSPAWGTMIVKGATKGSYRLTEALHGEVPHRRKAKAKKTSRRARK